MMVREVTLYFQNWDRNIRTLALLCSLLLHAFLLYLFFDIEKKNNIQSNISVHQNYQNLIPEQRAHRSVRDSQTARADGSQKQQAKIIFQSPSNAFESKTQVNSPSFSNSLTDPSRQVILKEIQEKSEPKILPELSRELSSDQKPQTPTQVLLNTGQADIQENPFVPSFKNYFHNQKHAQRAQQASKGFFEAMERGGENELNINGHRGKVSVQDLKTVGYVKSIIANIQAVFQSDSRFITLAYDESVMSSVEIIIDKQGYIISLRISNPPENTILERHVKELIYQASPFLPIPSHFNQQTFTIHVDVSITLSAGTHRMQWRCY